jgi:hypothetical protein
LVAVAALGFSLLNVDGVRHQLQLSFTRMPSPYTELYFVQIPATIISPDGESRQLSTDFVLSNHEGDTTTYGYVAQVLNDIKQPIAAVTGSVLVPDGARKATPITFEFPSAETWTAVEVQLTGRSEAIRYLKESLS